MGFVVAVVDESEIATTQPSVTSFHSVLEGEKTGTISRKLPPRKGLILSQLNLIHAGLIIIPAGYARLHTRVSRLIRPIGTQRRVVSRLFRV